MKRLDRVRNARAVKAYEIDTLGAPFKVTLHNSVTLSVDPVTGEEKVHVPNIAGLINSVVRSRVTHPRKLNGKEIKFIRHSLGVKASLVAKFLEMSPEHFSRCEAGTKVMSASNEKFFRLAAFVATFFSHPEEVFSETDDDVELEAKVTQPLNDVAKKLLGQFISMKIQSAFDVKKELHLHFTRKLGTSEEPTTAPSDHR